MDAVAAEAGVDIPAAAMAPTILPRALADLPAISVKIIRTISSNDGRCIGSGSRHAFPMWEIRGSTQFGHVKCSSPVDNPTST